MSPACHVRAEIHKLLEHKKVGGPKAPPLSDGRYQARGFLGSEMLPLTVLV